MTAEGDMPDHRENGQNDGAGHAGSLQARIYTALLRHPMLSGVAAAVLGILILLMTLPSAPEHPAESRVSIAASTTAEPAAATAPQPAAAAAVKPQPLEEPAPSGTVPVVAEAAVVLADAGLNRRVVQAIDTGLPRDITVAISVYANNPAEMLSTFRQSGRDVWLQLAAQSLRPGVDPGPLAISSTLERAENAALITRQIGMAAGGAVGVYVPEDAEITANDSDMWRDLATDVISENLMVLDATRAKVATSLYMQKSEAQINAYLKADVTVSGALGPAALKAALTAAEPDIIKQQQAIVVVTQPTAMTVQTVAEWIKTFGSKGIQLVPATRFTGLKP